MSYVNGNVKVNGTGLFSENNHKTACPSWSISPSFCAGKKGTICAHCYAQKGNYLYPVVKNGIQKRGTWFTKCPDNIVTGTMIRLIQKQKIKYIRVFESGDFSSIKDIEKWYKIASSCPEHKFWIPTRTWHKKDFLPYLQKLNGLKNVVVRPSSLDFDKKAPIIKGLAAGTTAYTKKAQDGHIDCPGSCENCRVCWGSTEKITYHYHQKGNKMSETKYTLQLVDVQEIAKNAGIELKKSEAKEVLNQAFTEMCNSCENILAEKAKEFFNAGTTA